MFNWLRGKKEEKEITKIYFSPQCKQKMLHAPLHLLFGYESKLIIFGCQRVLSNVTAFSPPTVLTTLTWKVDIGEKNFIVGTVFTKYFYEGLVMQTGVGKWARLTLPNAGVYIDMSITDCHADSQLHFASTNLLQGSTMGMNHLSFDLPPGWENCNDSELY